MQRPPAEVRGRLSYRPGWRGPRLSLFHLKLTDSALRALLTCQRLQGSPRPVIAFQGSQGYLKIPCGAGRSCLFTFYLSRYTKEKPQGSFDCVRQSVSSRWERSRLETKGVIQEKITVCATAEAYQQIRRPCGGEIEAWSRGALRSAPAAAPIKQERSSPLPAKSRPEDPRRKSSPPAPAGIQAVAPQSHHQTFELLAQKDRARLQLLTALQEVGQLHPRGRRYSLKQELLRQQAQASWPGYIHPWRRQGAARVWRRRQTHQASPSPSPPSPQVAQLPSPRGGRAKASSGGAAEQSTEQEQRPENHHWEHNLLDSLATESSEEEASEGEAAMAQPGKELQVAQQHLTDKSSHSSSGPDTPNFYLKYMPIRSAQQCQAYKEDFSMDYAEYRHLHAQIGSVSKRFAQLGARLTGMQPGTEEYKGLADQISQEYLQFKKVYPNYQKEKHYCEYLHEKLSYIKSLILTFEQNRP